MPRSGSAPTTEACASFLDSLPGLLKPSDPCGRLGSGRTIATGSERVNELKPLAQQWVPSVIAGRSEHRANGERVTRGGYCAMHIRPHRNVWNNHTASGASTSDGNR